MRKEKNEGKTKIMSSKSSVKALKKRLVLIKYLLVQLIICRFNLDSSNFFKEFNIGSHLMHLNYLTGAGINKFFNDLIIKEYFFVGLNLQKQAKNYPFKSMVCSLHLK
ncbi:hypothetical protein BpHYR1_054496 [Brachionus plicatilis]|uniref:Uncharacterized protein n=1 Tax=Brachionus plicatilis TaxID=10195 RepID=A0A3M7S7P0_BRAPC|nr:hypothetical protein BpHYR1_054496 [Brachionus plicatilis]